MLISVLALSALILLLLIVFLLRYRAAAARAATEVAALKEANKNFTDRFAGVLDAEAEGARVLAALRQEQDAFRDTGARETATRMRELAAVRQQIEVKSTELAALTQRITALQIEFKALDEEENIRSFGFYKPRYDFADSTRFQTELERIRGEQKAMLQKKTAATCQIAWTVNGSKAEGQKSVNQTLKLMLRAFNGECDAAVAKVKYNNVGVMEARIQKAHEKINNLAEIQKCTISRSYLQLKLQELYLDHEYQEKLQEEKEEQRQIREQMREEEIAQREFEKAQAEAEREEKRYEQALTKARQEVERATGEKQAQLLAAIESLEQKLEEARAQKERAISRAQLTKSGHVYVISNIGSFGEHVYKIGMTRRLDPLERVRELGAASVPFQFDVHAVIFSEDAPALEAHLHRSFRAGRVNRVNERKEFFRIPLDFIVSAVREKHGEIAVTRAAEAAEYRKTLAILAEERRAPIPAPAPPPESPPPLPQISAAAP